MSRIKIEEPGKPVKWVKEINKLDGIVTFTTNRDEAYNKRSGFYCQSEIKTLKATNPEQYDHTLYPELKYAVIDEGY